MNGLLNKLRAYRAGILLRGRALSRSSGGVEMDIYHSELLGVTAEQHQALVTVASVPLTLSGQQVTFNYDATDFQLSGNDLQVKDSGINHGSLTNTHNLTTDIDHDSLTNYDANKHIDHTAVSILNGNGITGGGDLTADRTLALTALISNWDIGDGKKLLMDGIRARDAAGLELYNDGGNGIFVGDSGDVRVQNANGLNTGPTLTLKSGETGVLADEMISRIDFASSDTSLSRNIGAYIRAVAETNYDTTDPDTRLEFATSPTTDDLQTRMTIDSDGNIAVTGTVDGVDIAARDHARSHALNSGSDHTGNLDTSQLPTGGNWSITSDLHIKEGDNYILSVDYDNDRVGILCSTPITICQIVGTYGDPTMYPNTLGLCLYNLYGFGISTTDGINSLDYHSVEAHRWHIGDAGAGATNTDRMVLKTTTGLTVKGGIRAGGTLLPDGSHDLGSPGDPFKDFYMTGDMSINGTVDGVDISTHAGSTDSHHDKAHSLHDVTNHSDVTITALTQGELLIWNAGASDWRDGNHSNIAGVTSDQHHAQSHTIVSHNDTTATGAELEELTDGSNTTLHVHDIYATDADLSTHATDTTAHHNVDAVPVQYDAVDGIASGWAYDHVADTTTIHGITDTSDLALLSGNVNQLADITSAGADIESAATLKHSRSHDHSNASDGNDLNPTELNIPTAAPASPVVGDFYLNDGGTPTLRVYTSVTGWAETSLTEV